jgi:deoxyribodipyrimidine photolyase-related protein
MSDYCRSCRYDPPSRVDESASGSKPACPVTTLYWNFIAKNRMALSHNPRTSMMVRNLDRFDADELAAISRQAAKTLAGIDDL